MKILVTGATGFIGTAIVKELKAQGHEVTALARKTSKIDGLKNENIPIVYGDINDPESLKRAFQGQQAVVHTAAYVSDWGTKKDYIRGIYQGTQNVLEALVAAGVRRLIFFSSVVVFGGAANVAINETFPLKPMVGWYTKAKIMAENMIQDYIQKKLLDITIVHPPWVYGEGDRTFIPAMVQAIKGGYMMFFRSGGRHAIEINYVGNIAAAVAFMIDNPATYGERYILADDPKITFREFVNTVAKKLGRPEVRVSLPYPLAYLTAACMEALYRILGIKNRPFLTRMAVYLLGNNIMYDTSKLKALGFKQRYTFEEVIRRMKIDD
jgi:nucleoside-diphosphate-sugar epimerase